MGHRHRRRSCEGEPKPRAARRPMRTRDLRSCALVCATGRPRGLFASHFVSRAARPPWFTDVSAVPLHGRRVHTEARVVLAVSRAASPLKRASPPRQRRRVGRIYHAVTILRKDEPVTGSGSSSSTRATLPARSHHRRRRRPRPPSGGPERARQRLILSISGTSAP